VEEIKADIVFQTISRYYANLNLEQLVFVKEENVSGIKKLRNNKRKELTWSRNNG
jgi:hypothetical protein